MLRTGSDDLKPLPFLLFPQQWWAYEFVTLKRGTIDPYLRTGLGIYATDTGLILLRFPMQPLLKVTYFLWLKSTSRQTISIWKYESYVLSGILRYVEMTAVRNLIYKLNNEGVEGYDDAAWISTKHTEVSTQDTSAYQDQFCVGY